MEKPQKLASGRWRARIYRDGKRVSLGVFDTKQEAVAAQAHAIIHQDEKRGSIKFWRYAEAHLMARKHDLAPGTWDNYIRDYRNHLQPTFGEKKLTDITPNMVRRWWTSMEDKKIPRRSSYMLLSNIMKQASEDGEILKWVPIKGASRNVSTQRASVDAFNVQMLKLATADPQVATLLQVLLSSGLRIGEVLALDWEDVDLEQGTLHVHRHLTKYGLKPGRKRHPEADILQPISEAAVSALTAWKQRGGGRGPVWLNSASQRLSYNAWHDRWLELRKEFGLEHVHTHDIRAVHLTEFAAHATLAELMERGGHTDIRSALVYQRPSFDRQKQIVKQLAI
ncbi:integrase [Microbacterium ginsengiterrae]|uniref:Integrase n=1 Tax=Microbacterium ginsengiterrae TaxID=546115 RepID=A0A7W9FBQ6_9MICO|nr:tyrosine-type recombinase/integrase [Microbacterium ginsengiterrae]MBB5741703.1 integrase [Microbacterium ginsengiterrae]